MQTIGPIKVGAKYPFNGTMDYDKVCVRKETVTYTATGGIPTYRVCLVIRRCMVKAKHKHIYQDLSTENISSAINCNK